MTRMHRTNLLVAASVVILSSSVDGFSPLNMRPQVRCLVPESGPTELWGKKKKNKKNKNKKKNGGKGRGGAVAAVAERPTRVETAVVEEDVPPPVVEEAPVAIVEEEAAPLADGELEDPALKMIANEMFQRGLLAQQFAYTAKAPEAETVVAEVAEPEPEPVVEEPEVAEPKAEVAEPEPEPVPGPMNEMFQRGLLARQFANVAKAPEPEPVVAEVAEPEPEPKAEVAEPVVEEPVPGPMNEMFQRGLLARQFANTAKAPEPEPVVAEVAEPEPEPVEEDLDAKYAAIDDVGERAYAILSDLGMFNREN